MIIIQLLSGQHHYDTWGLLVIILLKSMTKLKVVRDILLLRPAVRRKPRRMKEQQEENKTCMII